MRRLLVLVLAIGCGGAPPPPPPPPAQLRNVVEAPPIDPAGKPDGYVEVIASRVVELQDGDAVFLVDEAGGLALPIFIGGTEANSITLRLRNERFARPLTHDLLDAMLRRMNASVVKVQVDDLRDNTFIGSVTVRSDEKVMKFDARPSDAIALALGARAPIYVKRSVLDAAGIPLDHLKQLLAPATGAGPLG